MSRERFWYYLIGVLCANFITINLKLIFHKPRPVEMWTDIWFFTCKDEFGSPSNHCAQFAAALVLILLDQYFPSSWSREVFPELNKRSIRSHKISFLTNFVLIVFAQSFLSYDRLLLGMHSLDQIMFGTLIGIWCAACCHICLRDKTFSHFSGICHSDIALTGPKTLT